MLYADDPAAEERTPDHEIRIAMSLISRIPRISVLAYFAKRTAFFNESMIMHR
ncbi:MAG TPA: citrate synthase, partial [Coriobacteriia bacterium]|nr:citrate synthase [Coriobacteriia bacterium]